MHGHTSGSASQRPPYQNNLIEWYRAEKGITLNGSNVSAWASGGSRGKALSQGTATNQPAYSASDSNLNNRPSVQCDGSDNFLAAATAADWKLLHDCTGCTLYVAGRIGSALPAVFGNLAQTGADNVTAGSSILIYNDGHLRSLVYDNALAVIDDSSAAADFAATTKYVITYGLLEGATLEYYARKNGAALRSGAATQRAGNDPVQPISFGALAAATFPIEFQYGDILIYNVQHTAAQALDVERWLGRRRGITVS